MTKNNFENFLWRRLTVCHKSVLRTNENIDLLSRPYGTAINNSRTKEAIKRRKQATRLIGINMVCLRTR
jgi:hypothetical protein